MGTPTPTNGLFTHVIGDVLCSSRKYPDPHHGGNWKFQGGGEGWEDQAQDIPEGRRVGQLNYIPEGQYHFVFDLSSNIASYRRGRSFLGHK